MINYVKGYFADWNGYERMWLFASTLVILGLSYYWKDSWIGIIASLTGIWCVVLVAKGRISNYLFGIVNALAYSYVAFGWKYYGEVILNMGYFLPMQFVGLYLWTRLQNRKENTLDEVKVKLLSAKGRMLWGVGSLAGIVGYGLVLRAMGASLPFWEAGSTVFSVIAMILMAGLYMEQWVFWILVNIVSIVLWAVPMLNGGNDVAILVMWVAFLINAFYGMANWLKLYKEQGNG